MASRRSSKLFLTVFLFHVALADVSNSNETLDYTDYGLEDDIVSGQKVQPRFATICETPNGEKGLCVVVAKCPIFAKLNLTPEHSSYDFFQASTCSPKKAKQLKVCCGSASNFNSQIPKKQQATEEQISQAIENDDSGVLPKDCGKQKLLTFGARILSGKEASLGEFPWVARMRHRNRRGDITNGCAAILIHEKFAITAAHCLNSRLLRIMGPTFDLLLGDHNTSSAIDCYKKRCAPEPQKIRVGYPIVYSGYDAETGNHNNDIAVLPLKVPAQFTNFVRPICLPEKAVPVDAFTVAGWGRTEKVEESDVKLKLDLPRFPMKNCTKIYQNRGVILNTKNQLCAGGIKGEDTCTGDSGGPLMAFYNDTWYAEGVVSFGFECGENGVPGVYTNIPKYVPWIKNTIIRKLKQARSRIIRNKHVT